MKAFPTVLLPVAALVLGIASFWWFFHDPHRLPKLAFDQSAWRQADPVHHRRTVRSQMIKDLFRRHKFNGWTRQQVIDLLGKPTAKWPGFDQWDIIYVLGAEPPGPMAVDDEALGFKFDARDRVEKYGLSVN